MEEGDDVTYMHIQGEGHEYSDGIWGGFGKGRWGFDLLLGCSGQKKALGQQGVGLVCNRFTRLLLV
jgi:hypothetical protein